MNNITQIYEPSLAQPLPFIFKGRVHQVLLVALSIVLAAGLILYMLNPLWSPLKIGLFAISTSGMLFTLSLITIKSVLYPDAEKISVYVQTPKAASPYSEQILQIFEDVEALPEYSKKLDVRNAKSYKAFAQETHPCIVRAKSLKNLEVIAIRYRTDKENEGSWLILYQDEDWLQTGKPQWKIVDKGNLLGLKRGFDLNEPAPFNFVSELVKNGSAQLPKWSKILLNPSSDSIGNSYDPEGKQIFLDRKS